LRIFQICCCAWSYSQITWYRDTAHATGIPYRVSSQDKLRQRHIARKYTYM